MQTEPRAGPQIRYYRIELLTAAGERRPGTRSPDPLPPVRRLAKQRAANGRR